MAICVEAAVSGGTYIWGAPTFDQVRIGFNETRRAAAGVFDFNQSRMTATSPTGGEIIYRSLDNPDNARGYTANGVVIDESGDVKQEAWYEVLRPMLIDTGGWAWNIGTPKGRNWFWQEHHNAQDRDDSAAWQVPTLGVAIEDGQLIRKPHPMENPDVPFAEIEQLYRTMPERVFQQEILAEFIEDIGGVFRRVREAATATPQDRARGSAFYTIGVDWGRHNDFTVITVIDTYRREMVYMDRFTQIDYATQISRLKGVYERFPNSVIFAELNAMGEPLIEQMLLDGLPVNGFQTTYKTKEPLIRALEGAFEGGHIKILNDPVLIGELQAYEQERLATGWRFSAPEGMHDDCVMSLALAWHGVADAAPVVLW